MNTEKQFHIGLSKTDGARYALLPGDPGRVLEIAGCLEQPAFVAQNREFTTYAGLIAGERVLVTSTGIGGPSAAIALEELCHIGVDTIVRVGTCGGMQKSVCAGDLVLPTAAVRMEGTSREYMPLEYPAAADFSITAALAQAARDNALAYHTGVIQSKDSFYGQHSPDSMPVSNELNYKWQAWIKAGVLASEMECAALFTVAAVRGIRAGAVLTALWNQENGGTGDTCIPSSENAIRTAAGALCRLIEKDKLKNKANCGENTDGTI